jgi:23S rRNA-/tRNA-specific pseudouridylate synthase
VEELVVAEKDAAGRVDKWLSTKFPEYSRAYLQFLVQEGAVLVNGSLVKKKISFA